MKKLGEKVTTSQKNMSSHGHIVKNAHTAAPGTAKYANLRCIYTGLYECIVSVEFFFFSQCVKNGGGAE